METGSKVTVMVALVMGRGGLNFGVKTCELNTAGAPKERVAKYQQERECQQGRRTAENPVQRLQQDQEHHRQLASVVPGKRQSPIGYTTLCPKYVYYIIHSGNTTSMPMSLFYS